MVNQSPGDTQHPNIVSINEDCARKVDPISPLRRHFPNQTAAYKLAPMVRLEATKKPMAEKEQILASPEVNGIAESKESLPSQSLPSLRSTLVSSHLPDSIPSI
jgi:hypothetical protein